MVTVAQQTLPFIRPDGKEKVTGLGRYTADLTFTGQLQAKLKFADHPHARIISIDVSKARALAGVFAEGAARVYWVKLPVAKNVLRVRFPLSSYW